MCSSADAPQPRLFNAAGSDRWSITHTHTHTLTHTTCLRLTSSCRTNRSNWGRASVTAAARWWWRWRSAVHTWRVSPVFFLRAVTRKQEAAGIRTKFSNKIPVSPREMSADCRCPHLSSSSSPGLLFLTCLRSSSSATSGRGTCLLWTKPSSWCRTSSPWPSSSPSSGRVLFSRHTWGRVLSVWTVIFYHKPQISNISTWDELHKCCGNRRSRWCSELALEISRF